MMEIVQFICEIGNISSKMEIYHRKLLIYLRKYTIYRFFDKTSIKKSYFISEKQRNCQKIYQKILKRIVKLC